MGDIKQLRTTKTLLNSGDILRSRYRILHQLGHGGFSRTYLAEDINRFDERCVLKEFAPQLKGTFALEKAQELFEREAGVLYRLKHPQIPQFQQLFRYKQQDEGHLFLVQDYVEGTTYHALLNQRLETGNKFSEAEVKQLLTQVLPILEYIHSMGVIHRDISPDNLILHSHDQLPVLIDFGCIKEVEIKTQSQIKAIIPNASISLIGTALGKTGYSPPEQAERGIVYAHSDLYALAATIVALLTGKEPQRSIDLESYRWHWEDINLSPKLEWILNTMLAPNPSDRFGSAAEVSKTLQDIDVINVAPSPNTDETNHSQLKSPKKTAVASHLLAKSLFFVPFTVVLLLAGYICLKAANLEVIQTKIFNNNSSEINPRLQDRLSQGEKILIPQTITPAKEMAVAAFARGNYRDAAYLLETSLKTEANDPEALIYLKNARIGRGKAYSIAVSIPIGSDVNAAQEILRGVAQGQDRINQAGGINNLPLKVHIINDDNDPAIAKQVAQSLGKDKTILGVVGHYASDVTLATAPIYEANKLVAISPISTSVELTDRSPYVFRTVPSDYLAARGLAQYMLEKLQQKKVAIFYNSQSNYSESLKSEFRTSVYLGGGEVVDTFDLADPDFDASGHWQQAADSGAEAIMLAANTSTLDKALQVAQVNRQRLSLLGGDDVYTPKTLQIAGATGNDMVLAIPWHSRSNPDSHFASVARQLWGGEVNWRSAMAYDATKALIAAIAQSDKPTRLSVRENLSDPDFTTPGANSQVNFLPSGDRFTNIQLVQMQPSNNKFGYEFVPID